VETWGRHQLFFTSPINRLTIHNPQSRRLTIPMQILYGILRLLYSERVKYSPANDMWMLDSWDEWKDAIIIMECQREHLRIWHRFIEALPSSFDSSRFNLKSSEVEFSCQYRNQAAGKFFTSLGLPKLTYVTLHDCIKFRCMLKLVYCSFNSVFSSKR